MEAPDDVAASPPDTVVGQSASSALHFFSRTALEEELAYLLVLVGSGPLPSNVHGFSARLQLLRDVCPSGPFVSFVLPVIERLVPVPPFQDAVVNAAKLHIADIRRALPVIQPASSSQVVKDVIPLSVDMSHPTSSSVSQGVLNDGVLLPHHPSPISRSPSQPSHQTNSQKRSSFRIDWAFRVLEWM